ncbi:hypothetical protein WA171_002201, partial [Blastocystis sp. BT1]
MFRQQLSSDSTHLPKSCSYDPLNEEETRHLVGHNEHPYLRVSQSPFSFGDYHGIMNPYQNSFDYSYGQLISPTSSLSVDLENYRYHKIRPMKDSLPSFDEVDVTGEYYFEPNRAPLQQTVQPEIRSYVYSQNHQVTRPTDSCIPILSVPSVEGSFTQKTLSRREKKMERKRASY